MSTTAQGPVNRYEASQTPATVTRTLTMPDRTTNTSTAFPNGQTTVIKADGMRYVSFLAPDPRWGLEVPFVGSYQERTPSGLVGLTTRTRTVTLADPADPLSLLTSTEAVARNGRVTTSSNTPRLRRARTLARRSHHDHDLDALRRVQSTHRAG